jgi:hypothetical protein
MSWMELKDLGSEYGRSLSFARTYRQGSRYFGMIEYRDRADADMAIRELDNRRVQGSRDRLRASYGDTSTDLGPYKGRGEYGGDRDRDDYDRDRGRDRRDDYDRGPPACRRSRTPPPRRQRNDKGPSDEEIMTLFLKDLPQDAREEEVSGDLERSAQVLRVVLMRRDGNVSAFVRFKTVRDAERALEDVMDGLKVCDSRVHAEMARRNTDV